MGGGVRPRTRSRAQPDVRVRNAVIRGLARNQLRYGRRYCPCRIRKGVPEEDAKIACPCVYHLDEIAGEGKCHCNLFFRKDAVGREE
ncbi:ferredoxin-thioredoxin reductase catalytic domain-containing protein [Methanoculleus receptaculi]|uniref:ferredoxin:thioredoxin reductase n=1 Tax=Methanoculleus receptaculi TaxID=394967 RepID=A0AAX4FY05_9EURY|nr:ferredoxin-thioredoxin reductase catalytic domain-containing protein [Methanoculleus receptaculi]WOX58695.1 ferredoxin-thioredoxin reductase catalytic domain-containing protein [Methanoculleus receptaculi]